MANPKVSRTKTIYIAKKDARMVFVYLIPREWFTGSKPLFQDIAPETKSSQEKVFILFKTPLLFAQPKFTLYIFFLQSPPITINYLSIKSAFYFFIQRRFASNYLKNFKMLFSYNEECLTLKRCHLGEKTTNDWKFRLQKQTR